MADRNLMDRIARAEAELQSVMNNRSTLDHVHQDSQSKDRWQHELEARMNDLGNSDKFATNSDLWNKDGAAPPPPRADDVESFTQAVLECLPAGDQYGDVIEGSLEGTPYEEFGRWYVSADTFDQDAPIDEAHIHESVAEFLACSHTLSATAVNAGGSPQRQFADGERADPAATPGASRPSMAAGHDLLDFISAKKTQPAKPKQSLAPRKVVVHVTVEIGDGRTGTIDVYEGDDPRALAADFVQEHELSEQVVGPLSQHVASSIEAVKPQLHTPRRQQKPATAPSASPRRQTTPKADWMAKMSQPLRAARASMDPSRSMGRGTPGGLFEEGDSQQSTPRGKHIDALGMTPQSTSAAQAYVASKEHNSGLDDRGAQLSARMRKSGKAGMAVSARLYKDASVRQQKLKTAQKQREEEEVKQLEEEIKQERAKWGGEKSGSTQRYTIDANGEQKQVHVCDALFGEHEKRAQKHKQAVDKHLAALAAKEEELLKKSKHAKWGVPRISKKAKDAPRQGSNVWERICDWDGSQRKKHLEAQRKLQEQQEMEGCTFDIAESIASNPEAGFGGRSEKLVKKMLKCVPDGQEVATSRFEALYNDARQRQLRIEQYQNWYPEDQTFNPDIGPDRYRPRVDETEEEFVNRLTYCKQERLMSQPPAITNVDQNTGQPLFQPQTGRAPLFQRNASGLPIGDYLHSYSYEKDERKELSEKEQDEKIKQLASQPKTTSNSDFIMERMREQQLFEIFSVIDQDGDGVIDPTAARHAAQTSLPAEIANDVVPLVLESGTPHNFESFYHLCKHVVSSAQVGPKGYLVPERERHMRSLDEYVSSKDPSKFQMTISQKSVQLANERRQHRSGSLYDALSEEREVWDERRRHMSEIRAAEDLAACTFQPNVERVGAKPQMSNEVAQRLVKPVYNIKAVEPR